MSLELRWSSLGIGAAFGILVALVWCCNQSSPSPAGDGGGGQTGIQIPVPTGHLFKDSGVGNCGFDGGETGLAGKVVKLYDSSGNLVSETVTTSDGEYWFSSKGGPFSGDYKVKVDPSPGLQMKPACDFHSDGSDVEKSTLDGTVNISPVDFPYKP